MKFEMSAMRRLQLYQWQYYSQNKSPTINAIWKFENQSYLSRIAVKGQLG